MKTATLFADTDGSIAQNTIPYEIGDLFQFSVQIKFTGDTLAGTLQILASNIGGRDECCYVALPGGNQTVSTGTTHLWNVTGASYRWVMVKWTPTAGSGNIAAYVVAKEPINRY